MADKIDADGQKQTLCVQWTSNIKRTEIESKKLNLQISSSIGSRKYPLKCRTVQDLSLPKQLLHFEKLSSQFEHLKNLPVASYNNAEVGILIGINNPTLLLTSRYKFQSDEEPIAAFTKLGCVIFGSNSTKNDAGIFHVKECECFVDDDKIDKLMRENYDVESLGLLKSNEIVSTEEQRAYEI